MAGGFQGQSGKQFTHYSQLHFQRVEAVVVSGDGPNLCGHMLLQIDDWYFHVSAVYSYPRFLHADDFPRYLTENGKTEIFRVQRQLLNPHAARNKLATLLRAKWLWLIIPNNCADFVEEIIAAGENDLAILSNCPTRLHIKIEQEIRLRNMVPTRRGNRPRMLPQ